MIFHIVYGKSDVNMRFVRYAQKSVMNLYILHIEFFSLLRIIESKKPKNGFLYMISAGNLSVCGRLSVYGFVRRVICIDICGVCTVSTV